MCCLFIVLSYWFFTCTVTSHVLNVVKFFFTVTNVTSLLSMTQHLVIWKNFANNWNPSPGVYTNQELKFIYISLLISISKVVLSSMISCNINLSCCCMCNMIILVLKLEWDRSQGGGVPLIHRRMKRQPKKSRR